MDHFLRLMCELNSLTVHSLAAAAVAEGTYVSLHCRQLAVNLTSVFTKFHVISEADEDSGVISLSCHQITAVLSFSWPSLWIGPQSSVFLNVFFENNTHLVSTHVAPLHKLSPGLDSVDSTASLLLKCSSRLCIGALKPTRFFPLHS